MCKLNIGLTLNFLPVYYPSEEEINDPSVYAENVRRVMARSLNVSANFTVQAENFYGYWIFAICLW